MCQDVVILPYCIHVELYTVYILFSHLLTSKNSTIFWDVTLLALILDLSFFKGFLFFKFNMPSQNPDMNNSIRIIFIKIIIKINIIKIYIKNAHLITKNTILRESLLKWSIFSSAYRTEKKFLIILLATNQSVISFNVARESSTALSYIF